MPNASAIRPGYRWHAACRETHHRSHRRARRNRPITALTAIAADASPVHGKAGCHCLGEPPMCSLMASRLGHEELGD